MNNRPLILLLEENELDISALYSLYAELLPEKHAFWSRLSDEEVRHAVQIGNEKERGDALEDSSLIRGVIDDVKCEVSAATERARHRGITHETALRDALRIEQSLLEKRCFGLLSPSDDKVADVVRTLNLETERHTQAILGEMRTYRLDTCHPTWSRRRRL